MQIVTSNCLVIRWAENGVDDLTRTHASRDGVYFVQRAAMRNTTSQIDLLLSKCTEDLGNVFSGLALTSFGTGQCATEVERERVYTNALVLRHDAEQHAPTAAQIC